jgi:hypothetical protein
MGLAGIECTYIRSPWGSDWGFPYSETGICVFVCLTVGEFAYTLLSVRVTLGKIDPHLPLVIQQYDREAVNSFLSEYVHMSKLLITPCAPVEVDFVNKKKAPALCHSKILS